MREPREHRIRVTRSARFYTLGPEAATPSGRAASAEGDAAGAITELWIGCHGYRQLGRRFVRYLSSLDDGHRRIVAPEALNHCYIDDDTGPHGPESRVGATWMTREDRDAEIGDYIAYLDEVHERVSEGLDPGHTRVIALGFSQGVATASRWATLGQSRVDRLVLWAGTLPPDLDLADDRVAGRLRALRPIYVVGDADRFATDDALGTEAERLRPLGVEPEVIRFQGGHRIDADALRRVAEHIHDETP